MICNHAETTFCRVICKNGLTHYCELCDHCGCNVRGSGVWVAKNDVPNPDAAPIHKDLRVSDPANQTTMF